MRHHGLPTPISSSSVSLSQAYLLTSLLPLSLPPLAPISLTPLPSLSLSPLFSLYFSLSPHPTPSLFPMARACWPLAVLQAMASDTGEQANRYDNPTLHSPFHSFVCALLICWFPIFPFFPWQEGDLGFLDRFSPSKQGMNLTLLGSHVPPYFAISMD
jgi:hypothetical protein